MTTTALTTGAGASRDLGRYQPTDMKGLAWFADQAARSGLWKKSLGGRNKANLTPLEALMIMAEGDELGLTPLQSMKEISMIQDKWGNLKTIVGYRVIAARIQADPRTEDFDWDGDEKTYCKITAKRKGRNAVEIEVKATDLSVEDRDRHKDHMGDLLFGRAIRKLARRGFADMLLGVYIGSDEQTIEVAAIERVAQVSEYPPCTECGGVTVLRTNPKGGAFIACVVCGHTDAPPQEVRDVIRGGFTPPKEDDDVDAGAVVGVEARPAEPEGDAPAEGAGEEPPEDGGDQGGPQSALDGDFMDAAGIAPQTFPQQVAAAMPKLAPFRKDPRLKAQLDRKGWDGEPLQKWLLANPVAFGDIMAELEIAV